MKIKKQLLLKMRMAAAVAGVAALLGACVAREHSGAQAEGISYVDPLVGTALEGHVFPGVCMPFGLVQPSPETGNRNYKYTSGYANDDNRILFFAQTHLSGTGVADLGDVAFIPFAGKTSRDDFSSAFKKENESAGIGVYKVYLDDAKAQVRLSSSNRVAMYEIRFDTDDGGLLFDFQSGLTAGKKTYANRVSDSRITQPNPYQLDGAQHVKMWVERDVFFHIEFDRPAVKTEIVKPESPMKGDRYFLRFGLKKGDVLRVKIALSTTGVDGARANMASEIPHWDFEKVVRLNKDEWRRMFDRVRISSENPDVRKSFYTSLYHALIHPSNIADADGKYRGADGKIGKSSYGGYYSTFSLWDTYRASHPLFTIIAPERVGAFVNSMLDHYDAAGALPIWTLWGRENFCMIGNHSIPVIADAVLKDFDGIDAPRALKAMADSADKPLRKSYGLKVAEVGYYPTDFYKDESVSRTLEGCFDDYCVSRVARKLGDTQTAERLEKRSKAYKNLFDKKTGLFRGRDSSGKWSEPFDPLAFAQECSLGGDYTEANAWQYVWSVQHEPTELITLMGGMDNFVKSLDYFFTTKDRWVNNTGKYYVEPTGLIGQYYHGNEPSHHVIYLYSLTPKKWRGDELVREVFDTLYLPKPDGLCGNDDCGQMSAWYIFSALGFYPLNPASGEYIIGAPQVESASLVLPNGNVFKMHARNISDKNKYVKSVSLNGKPLESPYIRHADILAGGELEFEMADKPAK